jgi:SAM-dependent methyltransferase
VFVSWEEAVRWLLIQPDQQALVHAGYYDLPLESAARRYWQSDEWKAIRSFSPGQTGKALDIGAGHGITSYALAMDGWQVTAMEPDPSRLVGAGAIHRLASEERLPMTVLRAIGENIPFRDAVFPFIFARQTLHHARDLPSLCAEVFRVLKPGGVFIAAREHVISRPSDLPKFLARHPLHRLYGGENAYRLSEYKSALKSKGFAIHKILRSFDTVINYSPRSEKTLYEEIIRRIRKVPGCAVLFGLIFPGRDGFKRFLKYLSLFDQRPGRLYTFICKKP